MQTKEIILNIKNALKAYEFYYASNNKKKTEYFLKLINNHVNELNNLNLPKY